MFKIVAFETAQSNDPSAPDWKMHIDHSLLALNH